MEVTVQICALVKEIRFVSPFFINTHIKIAVNNRRKILITKGIDVSVFQGDIDWKKVAKSGIDFAIIKAGQGHSVSSNAYLFEDRYFKNNITEAYENGIKCGVYYYVTATTVDEARTEANHFLKLIKPHGNKISLWAVADVEDVTPAKFCGTVEKEILTDAVLEFCRTVKAGGFEPMIYTNRNYLKNKLNAERISGIPLWRAHWLSGEVTPDDAPTDYAKDMKLWQWGAEKVDGIKGDVDANFGYFTSAEPKPLSKAKRDLIINRKLKKLGISTK